MVNIEIGVYQVRIWYTLIFYCIEIALYAIKRFSGPVLAKYNRKFRNKRVWVCYN